VSPLSLKISKLQSARRLFVVSSSPLIHIDTVIAKIEQTKARKFIHKIRESFAGAPRRNEERESLAGMVGMGEE